jgi:hypothetical protein
MLSQPANVEPALITLIAITVAFTGGLMIALMRTLNTDLALYWEKKYLRHPGLNVFEIENLHDYIFSNTVKKQKDYPNVKKLFRVLKFLKKHLKTAYNIQTFVDIAGKHKPENITASELIKLIISKKFTKETIYRKIFNNYSYDLIISTVDIPEEWSDRMLLIKTNF